MLSLSVFYAFTVLLYSGGEPRLQTEDSCAPQTTPSPDYRLTRYTWPFFFKERQNGRRGEAAKRICRVGQTGRRRRSPGLPGLTLDFHFNVVLENDF